MEKFFFLEIKGPPIREIVNEDHISTNNLNDYSELVLKAHSEIEETVFVVKEEISKEHGSGNQLKANKTALLAINQGLIEWACVKRTTFYNPSSTQESWEEIPGVPSGPLLELQKFLELYPEWVERNTYSAAEWLYKITQREEIGDSIFEPVDIAVSKTRKNDLDAAWKDVARAFGLENVKWPNTLTGVKAAPIKIAQAVQHNLGDSWGLRGETAFRWEGEKPKHPGTIKKDYILVGCGHKHLKKFQGDFPLMTLPLEKEKGLPLTKAEAVS